MGGRSSTTLGCGLGSVIALVTPLRTLLAFLSLIEVQISGQLLLAGKNSGSNNAPVVVPVSFVCDCGALRVGKVEQDGLVVGVPNSVTSGIYDAYVMQGTKVEVTT